jgi:hypothetical protein
MMPLKSDFLAAALALTLASLGRPGHAGELSVSYFTIAAKGDPDTTTPCCVVVRDLVRPTLGTHGLPVLNPDFSAGGNRKYVVHDVNGDGEITWWTPGPTVTPTGTGSARLPIDNTTFFPPNGTGRDNSHGFQTAIFRGVIHIPVTESVTFKVGADDAAFVYLDGALVADLGGVHSLAYLPVLSKTVEPGDHCLEIFYADLYPTQAQLRFSVETPDVTVSQVPEIGSTVSCAVVIS